MQSLLYFSFGTFLDAGPLLAFLNCVMAICTVLKVLVLLPTG